MIKEMSAILPGLGAVDEENSYQPLILKCRHAKNRSKVCSFVWSWLVCWPDDYARTKLPFLWALYGIGLLISDAGTDVWVSWTHLHEGHKPWAGLTISFVILPIVFATGYHVLYKKVRRWYEVHPWGPFYWYVIVVC